VLGKKKRAWQDVDYVLHAFGGTIRSGRREYLAYVEAGVQQGRREDLTGGGLIRSLGGWSVVVRLRSKRKNHLKSDERILGDSEFVDSILPRAEERITRQWELRRRGYDLDRIADRVSEIYEIDRDEIFAGSRRKQRVLARSLFCFWAVRELGTSLTDLARGLGMSPMGVGYAVQRGEVIAREHGYQLIV
jgi:putative transposase